VQFAGTPVHASHQKTGLPPALPTAVVQLTKTPFPDHSPTERPGHLPGSQPRRTDTRLNGYAPAPKDRRPSPQPQQEDPAAPNPPLGVTNWIGREGTAVLPSDVAQVIKRALREG